MKYLFTLLLTSMLWFTQAHAQLGLGLTVEQLRDKVSYAESFIVHDSWVTVTYHDGSYAEFLIDNNKVWGVRFRPQKCPLKDEKYATEYSFKYGGKYVQLTHYKDDHTCFIEYEYSGIILRNTSWIYPAIFNRPEKTKK